ncbi:MAG: hypothetical protein PHE58_02650 [Candidatus Omnitrophica bacterium]|nr:hypothetical protein [Candidatus Omnitrophota bacterium]
MSRAKRGSVLVVSLWVVSLMAVFAISLAHRTAVHLKIAAGQRDRLQAVCSAESGINWSVCLLDEDSLDEETRGFDTRAFCGINRQRGADKEKTFVKELMPGARFSIRPEGGVSSEYGLEDEERKISVTGDGRFCKETVKLLLKEAGVDDSDTLAETMFEWSSSNSRIPEAKKEAFSVPEELRIVFEYFFKEKGENNYSQKSWELYNKIKDSITVFTEGACNLNTASEKNLRIIFRACVNTEGGDLATVSDADSLVGRISVMREAGGIFARNEFTEIEKTLTQQGPELTSGQKNILSRLLNDKRLIVSDVFTIISSGKTADVSHDIKGVYDRKNKKFLYWHEE